MRQLGCFGLLYIALSVGCFAQEPPIINPNGITIAIDKTPTSFNPFDQKSLMPQQYRHLLFDPLFRWNNEYQITPRLATNWKRINSTTVRFQLRKNIKFHSGNKLSSNDVIWSFEQAKKEKIDYTKFFNKIFTINRVDNSRFDVISSLTDFQLLDFLTSLFVLDSSFYKHKKTLLTAPPPILLYPITSLPASGTGPYLINDFNPALGIEMFANSEYWDGEPNVTYLRFMRVKSAESRLFALLADDVQVSASIPNKNINNITKSESKDLVRIATSDAVFFTINDKLSPALSNKKAREAIHLAINQQGMLKHILNGNGRVKTSFMSLAETRFLVKEDKEKRAIPEFNVKKSKHLLKKITLPKRMTLLVLTDVGGNTEQVATALTHMLKKVGIHLTTKKTRSKKEWDKVHSHYDFTLSAWHTQLMSRDNVYEEIFLNSNLSTYLQEKFKLAGIEDDINLQSEYFESLQTDEWIIPLFYQDQIWAKFRSLNLGDIFSSNGIPYWSLLKERSLPLVEPMARE